MRLLVDEDTQSHVLLRLLRESGHDVVAVAELGLNGTADPAVLARAITDDRVLLTRNCGDFLALHLSNEAHPGILAVYQDDDPSKDMSFVEIAVAVGLVEASTLPTAGQFLALNAWRPPTGREGAQARRPART